MNFTSVSPLLAQPAALSAGLALALLIFRVGAGQFRGRLFLEAVAIGAVLGALIAFVEAPLDLRRNSLHFSPATVAFLLAGWPEEAVKLIGIVGFLSRHYLARDRRDVTLAAASLALGFAVLENMLYVASAGANWERLAFLRAVTAAPFHVLLGITAGYGVSLAGPLHARGRWTLYVVTGLGLGAVHGAYDFAVISLTNGEPPPAPVARFAAALGLNVAAMLNALMTAAEAVAAVAALWALSRLPRAATPRTTGFWRRLALSRALGFGLGGAMMAISALFLAGAVAAAYVLDESMPAWEIATLTVLPFAVGLMLAAFHGGALGLSSRWRWGLRLGGAAAAFAAIAGAVVWGGAPVRGLIAARIEMKGMREAQKSDFDGALRDYDRALGWEPQSAEILARRAAALVGLERFDAALADLDRALVLDPGNPGPWLQRSELHRQIHDCAGAVADLEKAMALKPDSPALLALSAQARLENGEIAEARTELAKAFALAPRDPTTLRIGATLAVYDGDYDSALRSLNQYLHDQPNDNMVGFERGRVWLYKGDLRRALADFTVAERGLPDLYPTLWRFLAAQRGGQDSRPDLEARLRTIAPGSWPAPVARLYLGKTTVEEARAAAKDADQRCEADFYWGQWRAEAGDIDEGRRALRIALAECPTSFVEYEGARAALRVLDR